MVGTCKENKFPSTSAEKPLNPDIADDTTIGGQHIPKGTQIYYYSGAVHHTKSIFEDPHLFRPERFLDDQGVFRPDERVLYFGSGKRRWETVNADID